MKKYLSIITFIVFLTSCTDNHSNTKKLSLQDSMELKKTSDKLVDFFLKYKVYDANSVKEDMLLQDRQNALKIMIDTIGVFNNLEATIYDIKIENVDTNRKFLSYMLSIFDTHSETEAWEDSTYIGFIELVCVHFIKGNDYYFMKKIAEMPEFSTVYVDGFFAVDNKTNTPKMFDEISQLIHPTYFFHTTDISTKELSPISKNLKEAILAGRKVFDYTFMGKGEFDKKTNDNFVKDFKKSKTGLDKKDSLYLIRYMNEIMMDSPY